MVAQTTETMQAMMESFNDGVRVMMDAGRQTQQAWFKLLNDSCRMPNGFDANEPQIHAERVLSEFGPLVSRNMETLAQTFDTGMQAGMNVFNTMNEGGSSLEEADLQKKSRKVWDAALVAFRKNVEAASNAGVKTVDNCSAFVESVHRCEAPSKAASKSPKSGN